MTLDCSKVVSKATAKAPTRGEAIVCQVLPKRPPIRLDRSGRARRILGSIGYCQTFAQQTPGIELRFPGILHQLLWPSCRRRRSGGLKNEAAVGMTAMRNQSLAAYGRVRPVRAHAGAHRRPPQRGERPPSVSPRQFKPARQDYDKGYLASRPRPHLVAQASMASSRMAGLPTIILAGRTVTEIGSFARTTGDSQLWAPYSVGLASRSSDAVPAWG